MSSDDRREVPIGKTEIPVTLTLPCLVGKRAGNLDVWWEEDQLKIMSWNGRIVIRSVASNMITLQLEP